jgi:hypothetical protein
MMKQGRKSERIACALVAPFILRNSKVLYYIMIQLNGIDLVLELLLNDNDESSDEKQMGHFHAKAIQCIKRILIFVNYRQDLKQIEEHFFLDRRKVLSSSRTYQASNVEVQVLLFVFNSNMVKMKRGVYGSTRRCSQNVI